MQILTNFKGGKYQGKKWAMQLHGQVFPPCDCITIIATGEYRCCRFLRDRGRMGGGEIINKIGRGVHLPCPKLFLVFRVFESVGCALKLTRKKVRQQVRNSGFEEKTRGSP